MGRKLQKIYMVLAGMGCASMLVAAAPSNEVTMAVTDKQSYIENRMEELGSNETISRDGKTYAIVGNNLIPLSEKKSQLNYDSNGIPTSERTRGLMSDPGRFAFNAFITALAFVGGSGVLDNEKKKD